MPYLHMLGFEVMGYGCSSCVENSASASDPTVSGASSSLLCCGILAGNRNFEGRILPEIKANYLASPPLVIAYSIAGRIDIDFANEPIGKDSNDKPVFLRDIWPTRDEVQEVERRQVIPSVFKLVGNRVSYGNKEWCGLQVIFKTYNSLDLFGVVF
jgi:aconitate hydratase